MEHRVRLPVSFLVNVILYCYIYLVLSFKLDFLFDPLPGVIMIVAAIGIDYWLSVKRFRWYLRLAAAAAVVAAATSAVALFSLLSSDHKTLNIFDFVPYYTMRDLSAALFFVVFYFVFDAEKIIRKNRVLYGLSTIGLVVLLFVIMSFHGGIEKSIFKNYFTYALLLFIAVVLIIIRHINFVHYGTKGERGRLALKEYGLLGLIFAAMLVFLIVVTLQDYMKKSGGNSGGLFQSGLFKFDFSNFLELKDSIKLSEDRVLLMELSGTEALKNSAVSEEWNRQIYLKRFSLEEYVSPAGFKVSERIQEENTPPPYLSGYMWEKKNIPDLKSSADINETLYLLNIDPSSVMGSELLYKIIPIEAWKDSPFKQIYRSYSRIYAGEYDDIYADNPGQDTLLNNISEERRKMLLNWGGNASEKRIKELATEITAGYPSPFMKAIVLQEYLKDNYYYSLKPGLSGKKPPLEYFLFDSKKGYCSYYAFAMTLMLRSLGIASRVAVGFAPDMSNRSLNFYDVRECDGHAWVEVYFDGYGWVIFDPTSSHILPDDEFTLPGNKKDERDSLIDKILENRDKMKEITEKPGALSSAVTMLRSFINRSVRALGVLILLSVAALLAAALFIKQKGHLIRYYMTREPGRKVAALWKYVMTDLACKGYRINKNESIEEFAARIRESGIADIELLTRLYQQAVLSSEAPDSAQCVNCLRSYKKSIKKLSLAKRIFTPLNPLNLFRKILPLVLLSLFVPFFHVNADAAKPLETYITEARQAAEKSYFDKAFTLLNEAEADYPNSYLPNSEKGQILMDEELYPAAVKEFIKAKKKGQTGEEIYTNIAICYSKEGDDEAALAIFEEALQKVPESATLIDNLGWSYYKTHKYTKGITLVESKLDKYGNSADILMTLGTLYSSIWDYGKAKEAYLASIDHSYTQKFNDFRAIAYYNLALLEESFQYYDNAYNYAKAAISLINRSSAHMELAYLDMRAMDLRGAYGEIETASGLEPKTMFPESALCYLYMVAGHVDEAIDLAHSLLKNTDYTWMMYFGTSVDSYLSDLYKVLCYAYEGKSNLIFYSEQNTFWKICTRPFRALFYKIKSVYYNYRFTNTSIKMGNLKLKGGSDLEGLHQLFDGLEKIAPQKALKVSRLAAKIEIPLNGSKKRIYDAYEASLNRSLMQSGNRKAQAIIDAATQLDQKWERDFRGDLLVSAAKMAGGALKREIAVELFSDHPPFTPFYNIRVPAVVYAEGVSTGLVREIYRRGFYPDRTSPVAIRLRGSSSGFCSVQIACRDVLLHEFTIDMRDRSRFGTAFFVNVFRTELQ